MFKDLAFEAYKTVHRFEICELMYHKRPIFRVLLYGRSITFFAYIVSEHEKQAHCNEGNICLQRSPDTWDGSKCFLAAMLNVVLATHARAV